jgi:peptidoglycan-N-acetylglucosamine deacetylase
MTVTRINVLLFGGFKLVALLLWPWHPTAALVVFFSIDPYIVWQIVAPGAQGFGRIHTRFATDQREVWLTIDDGPDPDDTPQILRLLAHHRARATFFVVGQRAARYPNLITAIRLAGHEIAHHTHTHPINTYWAAGPRRLARELDDAQQVFATAGITPTRFRNPGGTKSIFQETTLAQRHLAAVAWTIRSWDSVGRNPQTIVQRILRQVTPGSIILLHEGARVPVRIRVKLIAQLLVALDKADYRCVIPSSAQLR